MSSMNRTILLLAASVLLCAGCAAIQRDTERTLTDAGFQMRRADTPERQADLRSLPPHRVVSRTTDGNIEYVYADPDNCRCLYVGGNKEYSEYERLKLQRDYYNPCAGCAGGAP